MSEMLFFFFCIIASVRYPTNETSLYKKSEVRIWMQLEEQSGLQRYINDA